MKRITSKDSSKGILQKVVAVGFVRDQDGCLLLIQRYEPSLPEISGRWELPGGTIEIGESPCDTVRREISEETGVQVEVDQMLPFPFSTLRRARDVDIHVIVLCFICILVEKPAAVHRLPGKIGAIQWIPLSQLGEIDLQDGTRLFLSHLLEDKRHISSAVTARTI